MLSGPRPKTHLEVVREGNPGHRPLKDPVVVPDAELPEPEWLETWPATRDKLQQRVNARAREVARREWRRVVPVLQRAAGLGAVDAQVLLDYCICVAQLDEANRALATQGMLMLGERGWQKNGYTTIAAQLRTQLARYIGELGLSPSARTRLTPPKGADDDGDPFAAVG
jgi:phage terminase, small subunit, putative, P27 family